MLPAHKRRPMFSMMYDNYWFLQLRAFPRFYLVHQFVWHRGRKAHEGVSEYGFYVRWLGFGLTFYLIRESPNEQLRSFFDRADSNMRSMDSLYHKSYRPASRSQTDTAAGDIPLFLRREDEDRKSM